MIRDVGEVIGASSLVGRPYEETKEEMIDPIKSVADGLSILVSGARFSTKRTRKPWSEVQSLASAGESFLPALTTVTYYRSRELDHTSSMA